jgi:hypothetical protein
MTAYKEAPVATAAQKEQAKRDARHAERLALREDRPDSWLAVDEDDELTGIVVDVDQAWSDVRDDGSWYPLLTVRAETATGYSDLPRELKVHCFSAVLYNEVMRRRPVVGETITISYHGTREPRTKGHSPTNVYRVRVHGREGGGAGIYDAIGSEQPASTVGRPKHPTAASPQADGAGVTPPPPGDDDFPGF